MMGPIEAVASVLAKPFTFSGRASRAEYWWFSLFCVFGMMVTVFADSVRLSQNPETFAGLQNSDSVAALFGMISVWFALLTAFPYVSVTIRRLHDIGLSGFVFLVGIIPAIGNLILLVLMVWPGQSVSNSYGDPWCRIGGRNPSPQGSHPYNQPVLTEQHQAMELDRKAEIRALYEQRVLGRVT